MFTTIDESESLSPRSEELQIEEMWHRYLINLTQGIFAKSIKTLRDEEDAACYKEASLKAAETILNNSAHRRDPFWPNIYNLARLLVNALERQHPTDISRYRNACNYLHNLSEANVLYSQFADSLLGKIYLSATPLIGLSLEECNKKSRFFYEKAANSGYDTARELIIINLLNGKYDADRPVLERLTNAKKHFDSIIHKDKIQFINVDELENALSLVQLTAGIGQKYMPERLLPDLPVKITSKHQATTEPEVKYNSKINFTKITLYGANSKNHITKQLTIGNSRFCYRHPQEEPHLAHSDKVIFIFAGRKNQASIPLAHGPVRVVLVLTLAEYEEMHIPGDIDILMIEQLHSATHGCHENIRTLSARRSAAFLFAHYLGLEKMIVMDDNLEAIHFGSNSQPTRSEWLSFYEMMSKKLDVANVVCMSVQTISPISQDKSLHKLGSKLFVYNMSRIRTLEPFRETEGMFWLQPPAKYANTWGEDYYFQLLLTACFGNKSVLVLSTEECGLKRLSANKNSYLKQGGTVADWWDDSINRESLLASIDSKDVGMLNIVSAVIERLAEIYRENEEAYNKHNRVMKSMNLLDAHWKVNAVSSAITDTNFITKLEYKGAFFERLYRGIQHKFAELMRYLRPYQHQAIQQFHATLKTGPSNGRFNMATGSGKTRVQSAMCYVSMLLDTIDAVPGVEVVIVVPTKQLVDQAYTNFMTQMSKTFPDFPTRHVLKISSGVMDISVGLYNHNDLMPHENRIIILCAQSYDKILDQISRGGRAPSDMILLDEYHTYKPTAAKILRELKGKSCIYGFTATPPSRGVMDTDFDQTIFDYDIEKALQDHYLSPLLTQSLFVDYQNDGRNMMLDKLICMLRDHYHPEGMMLNRAKGAIYFPNTLDARNAAEKIRSAFPSLPVFVIHSKVANYRGLIESFNQLTTPAIAIAVDMLKVGYDDPALKWVINFRHGLSEDENAQIIGRLRRQDSRCPKKIGYYLHFADANIAGYESTTHDFEIMQEIIKNRINDNSDLFDPFLLQYMCTNGSCCELNQKSLIEKYALLKLVRKRNLLTWTGLLSCLGEPFRCQFLIKKLLKEQVIFSLLHHQDSGGMLTINNLLTMPRPVATEMIAQCTRQYKADRLISVKQCIATSYLENENRKRIGERLNSSQPQSKRMKTGASTKY